MKTISLVYPFHSDTEFKKWTDLHNSISLLGYDVVTTRTAPDEGHSPTDILVREITEINNSDLTLVCIDDLTPPAMIMLGTALNVKLFSHMNNMKIITFSERGFEMGNPFFDAISDYHCSDLELLFRYLTINKNVDSLQEFVKGGD